MSGRDVYYRLTSIQTMTWCTLCEHSIYKFNQNWIFISSTKNYSNKSLTRGFGGSGYGLDGYDWLGGFDGFSGCDGLGGIGRFDGFSGCDGLGGFGGFDGFSGFDRFSFVYSATKGFISCAELPSTYTWLKGEPQPCSMYK